MRPAALQAKLKALKLGGMLLTAGFGYRTLPLASLAVTLVTLLLAELPLATPILWVSPTATWYPPGLAWLGLDPGRCLFAEARNDAESLGTLEVALRGGMAGVAESLGLSRLAARRLALAAKDGNSTALESVRFKAM